MILILILTLFFALSVLASVDPPGSISLTRPDPHTTVPQNANITYGFTSSDKQYWGLIQNIRMWYTMPDATQVQGPTYGPPITSGGTFQDRGYTPQECRSFPGTAVSNAVNATQTGQYTFFWNLTYVESSDSTKANATYCGPPPFSRQSWLVTSTVSVVEADLGAAVVAAAGTTMQSLPSKPTGKVNGGAAGGVLGASIWGSAIGLLLGLGLV